MDVHEIPGHGKDEDAQRDQNIGEHRPGIGGEFESFFGVLFFKFLVFLVRNFAVLFCGHDVFLSVG